MGPALLYRAFHEQHSSGVNSSDGFQAGVRKSEYQDPDHDSVRDHFDANNRYPTPWISTTDNLLRAIKRAHQLAGEHGTAGVSIAVIEVKECRQCEYHLAADLADQFNLESLPWHDEEYLFRYRIPREAIVCCLSLATRTLSNGSGTPAAGECRRVERDDYRELEAGTPRFISARGGL